MVVSATTEEEVAPAGGGGGLIPLKPRPEKQKTSDADPVAPAVEVGVAEPEAAAEVAPSSVDDGDDSEKFYAVDVVLLASSGSSSPSSSGANAAIQRVTLELSPADTVADVRQLLADTPESCYYTCFGLVRFVHTDTQTNRARARARERERERERVMHAYIYMEDNVKTRRLTIQFALDVDIASIACTQPVVDASCAPIDASSWYTCRCADAVARRRDGGPLERLPGAG